MSIQRLIKKKDRQPKLKHLSSAEKFSQDASLPLQRWKAFSMPPSEVNNNRYLGDRALQQQVASLRKKFTAQRFPDPGERPALFALESKYARGDPDKAYDLLFMIQSSTEGLIENYLPVRKLLGAENRGNVTCYLDSLLFAMFARLGFFDAILYTVYDDEPRQNLIVLVRLWVNMLRSGKLIPTDITRLLQNALAECGWEDAARQKQQDASEAFTFIAEKLDLPLVTLKMDIFHNGKEDASNDHRFINERLLEVAIPPERDDGEPILLEDCLELYFNNRIDVKRHLDRRNTLNSLNSKNSSNSLVKGNAAHIENAELDTRSSSLPDLNAPLLDSPSDQGEFNPSADQITNLPATRPFRTRTTSSLVRRRFIPDTGIGSQGDAIKGLTGRPTRARKGSVRKEVMMPAWQMFSLIPWYTKNTDGFQTAIHFSSQRPILGICLKRYSMLPDGRAIRLDTKIDIPTEIALPHFVNDDSLTEDAPLYGKFKLCLQAAVCHQGTSVDSGHYISLVRGTAGTIGLDSSNDSSSDNGPMKDSDHWLRFDDLAKERITLVDIEKALIEESPYILFYQITPLDEDADQSDPPTYSESGATPSVISPASDLKNVTSDVTGYSIDANSRLETGGLEQDQRAPSVERPLAVTLNSEDRLQPPRSSSSFVKNFSRNPRSSQGSDNMISTAMTYLSRRKNPESVEDPEDSETDSTRDSIEERKCGWNDQPSRPPSDEFYESDRGRSRGVLKKTAPSRRPDRECLVM